MHFLGELFPAENPEAQEGGFDEEGQKRLNGQGSAKNITNIAGVFGPVHAKLKFLDDTSDHTHRKVDYKEFAPKLGLTFMGFLSSTDIAGL